MTVEIWARMEFNSNCRERERQRENSLMFHPVLKEIVQLLLAIFVTPKSNI